MVSHRLLNAAARSTKVIFAQSRVCRPNLQIANKTQRHNHADSVKSSRRKSLTLSTLWGVKYECPISCELNATIPKALSANNKFVDLRQVRNLQHNSSLLKSKITEEKELEDGSFTSDVDSETPAVSKCPFHSMLKQSKRRHSAHAFQKTNFAQKNRKSNFQYSQYRRHSVSAYTIPVGSYSQAYGAAAAQGINNKINDMNKSIKHGMKSAIRYFFQDKSLSSPTQSYSKIPGPRGLPLLGSVLDYTFLGPFLPSKFNDALKSRHSTYGKIFKEKLLNEEFVYVSDPKDVEVLAQNEGNTPMRPSLDCIVESRKAEGLDVGITAMQGKDWFKLRSAINKVIMKPGAVSKFRNKQHQVTDDFIKFMKNNRSEKSGEIEDFEIWLNRWALESIAVILLDTRLGLVKEKVTDKTDPLAERLRKGMDVFFDYGAKLAFNAPTWKIWNTKDWKIYRQCQKDEFEAAGYYVDKKLKELNIESESLTAGEGTGKVKSFLEHLVKDSNLKRDESLTLCLELLAGGIDTSANAVVFTLYELAKNPKQQEELRRLIKEDQHLDDEALGKGNAKSSRYLRGCVWEALRLHPLTYVNMRETIKPLVLSGYEVPAGTTVRYTTHLTQLKNPEYFKEPESFIPERWIDRQSEYRSKQQFVFTPFGHGARQCPGRRIAEQELDLLIRDVLKTFKVNYHHEDMGTKVRLFNAPDKEAKFDFELLD